MKRGIFVVLLMLIGHIFAFDFTANPMDQAKDVALSFAIEKATSVLGFKNTKALAKGYIYFKNGKQEKAADMLGEFLNANNVQIPTLIKKLSSIADLVKQSGAVQGQWVDFIALIHKVSNNPKKKDKKGKEQTIQQQGPKELVKLKNGSIINGDIIEEITGISIKVKTPSGSMIVCNLQDIESIKRNKDIADKKKILLSNGSIIIGVITEEIPNDKMVIETDDGTLLRCLYTEITKIEKFGETPDTDTTTDKSQKNKDIKKETLLPDNSNLAVNSTTNITKPDSVANRSQVKKSNQFILTDNNEFSLGFGYTKVNSPSISFDIFYQYERPTSKSFSILYGGGVINYHPSGITNGRLNFKIRHYLNPRNEVELIWGIGLNSELPLTKVSKFNVGIEPNIGLLIAKKLKIEPSYNYDFNRNKVSGFIWCFGVQF